MSERKQFSERKLFDLLMGRELENVSFSSNFMQSRKLRKKNATHPIHRITSMNCITPQATFRMTNAVT